MEVSSIFEGIKNVGFPMTLVVYLLYILQTELKAIKERVIELDTFVKTVLKNS